MTMEMDKPVWIYDENYGFLNENARRLAEVLNDWDPHVRLMFIPERSRQASEVKPYATAYFHSMNQFEPSYFIKHYTEAEITNPARILADLFDMRDNDVNKRLENLQSAIDIMKAKEYEERMGDAQDRAKSFLRSPLHTYRLNGKKFDRHTGQVIK